MLDIVFDSVSKNFGKQQVLSGFSAVIPSGGITALMGPSGSGKTTIAEMLLRMQKPDSGNITGSQNLRFSCVFQEDRLIEHMSAAQNIALVLSSPVKSDIINALSVVGLTAEDIAKPVQDLSGGQRRRVALVRAMQAESECVVLDEAFSGIDKPLRKTCLEYVLAQQNGRTILLVTHSSEEAAICTKTINLSEG